MKTFSDLLCDFEPISLEEMDSVKLMDRTDTKFIFNFNLFSEILNKAIRHYKILQIGSERDFLYQTTYLDTNNFDFFNQHMTKRPVRQKVRYRIYKSTGLSFLEIKCKTNKKRTVKSRIKNKLIGNKPDQDALDFLSRHINQTAFEINPVLENNFHRLTLVNIDSNERITIDHHLNYNCTGYSQIELPYLAIAELKREGFTNSSYFLNILKEMQIRQTSFSKYCIGNALIRPMEKINILKQSFLKLNKIKNDKFSNSFG